MAKLQKWCPMIHKHTPVEERDDNTGWITLIEYDDEDKAIEAMNKPFSDGIKRELRVI